MSNILPPSSIIEKDFGIEKNGKVQSFFTNTCKRYMDKYTPTGIGDSSVKMKELVGIGPDYIDYYSPYAHYQHEGELYVDPDTGSPWAKAGATKVPTGIPLNHTNGYSHWDEIMMSVENQNIEKEVQEFMER